MISLVTTVFNDRQGVIDFFGAMEKQTVGPDEIVIVDAGSKDGTWEAIEQARSKADRPWKLTAEIKPGCNVAAGRNRAIRLSGGNIIVSTDIGCEWDREWMEELVRPLLQNPSVDLVVGSWAVKPEGLEGEWALTEFALKGEQVFSASDSIACSSRSVAYRKSVWRGVGGYPEDLTLAADDSVFNHLMEKAGVTFAPAPEVRCYWHRHNTLRAFFKEQFRYGFGDGEAGIRSRDMLFTGGRIIVEILGLLAVPVALLAGGGLQLGAGLLFLVALVSFAVRIRSLKGPARRLRELKVGHPLRHLLRFVYGTKLYWLAGFVKGHFRGNRSCRDCRERLASISPESYQARTKETDGG